MTALAAYRTDLDNLLATAVDASTWTDNMLDESLRQALVDYSLHGPIYETDFTVVTTGYEQDLGSITDLFKVEDMRWPWVEGDSWGSTHKSDMGEWRYNQRTTWRPVGFNTFYFAHAQPTAGDTIRVRYRKSHVIESLDAAVATTVEDVHRRVIILRAAAWCIEQRLRQITENPAIPKEAAAQLQKLYASYMSEYMNRLIGVQHSQNPAWSSIGL